MKSILGISFVIGLLGCATPRAPERSAAVEAIDRSSARIIAKKNADDGSRAGGIVAFFYDAESPVAQEAAEQYCGGPVRVKSEEYLPTGDVVSTAGGYAAQNIAVLSETSQARKSWRMVFECDRAADAAAVAAYKDRFSKPYVPVPGVGDILLHLVGL